MQAVMSHGELSFIKVDAVPAEVKKRNALVKESSQNSGHDHILENGQVYFKENVEIAGHSFKEVVYIVSDGNAVIKMRDTVNSQHDAMTFPEGVYEGITMLQSDHLQKTLAEIVD